MVRGITRWSAEDRELLLFLREELDIATWAIAALLDRSQEAVAHKIKEWAIKRPEWRHTNVIGWHGRTSFGRVRGGCEGTRASAAH